MKRTNHNSSMTFKLVFLVFISIIISSLFVGLISLFIIRHFELEHNFMVYPALFIGVPLIASALISIMLSTLASKKPLTELKYFITAIDRVANGDFTVNLDEKKSTVMNQTYKSFNSMVKELNSIQMLRNDFISNFSHEFKTPIVSIRGFAKLAKDTTISIDERNEYLDIIISEINRLVTLSNHTLLLTQLEAQEYVLEKEMFTLDEQIRECIVLLQNQWERKELNFKIELENMVFNGNKDLLQQLWINLLANAIKFTDVKGDIAISLTNTNDNAIVIISDSGVGMDRETQKRIFDKFYQGDSSRKTEGIGLGLSIVKRIVTLCGGTIDVNSEINIGTSFSIVLPNKTSK